MTSHENRLKIVIIDDSVVFRLSLYKLLQTFPEVGDINVASGGNQGIAKVALDEPDLVFCDIEMPIEDGDGITTLQRLRAEYPNVGVVMISSVNSVFAKKTIHSLSVGAVDFIAKPDFSDPNENERELRKLLRNVIMQFSTKKYTSITPSTEDAIPVDSTRIAGAHNIQAVLIGGATGGPQALIKLLPHLSANFPVPICIVQQMHSQFTNSLTEYLQDLSNLIIREAEEGQSLQAGHIYVAPGDRHLILVPGTDGRPVCHLDNTSPVNLAKPSIDLLFGSAAELYGGGVLSVILSGMGTDGVEGVRKLKASGGFCLVQDKESAVIFGIGWKVQSAGCADEMVSDVEMGNRINTIVNG